MSEFVGELEANRLTGHPLQFDAVEPEAIRLKARPPNHYCLGATSWQQW